VTTLLSQAWTKRKEFELNVCTSLATIPVSCSERAIDCCSDTWGHDPAPFVSIATMTAHCKAKSRLDVAQPGIVLGLEEKWSCCTVTVPGNINAGLGEIALLERALALCTCNRVWV
jgi:hypothetical protein